MNITLRMMRPEDKPFIYSTWLLGLYHGNSWFNSIEKKVFFDNYKHIVTKYLELGTVVLACLPDDEDVVLGYCCYHNNALDWIFVKKSWRKLGIGRQLYPNNVEICTHLTEIGKSLNSKTKLRFNPFV